MALQQRAVLTRARVITAAADVFARVGFAAASLSDITNEAKATKGALYFHFSGKDALAEAIISEQASQWPTLINAIKAAGPNPLVSVVALTYEVASRIREDSVMRAGLRLSLEVRGVDEETAGPFPNWIEETQDLLTESRRQGLLRVGVTPAPAARAIVGSCFGIQHLCAAGNQKELEGRLDEFWKIFLPGIAAEPDWVAMQRLYRRTLSIAHKSAEHAVTS